MLQTELESIVERLDPSCAAVEAPFHGASARSALQLAHARGVVLAVLARTGLSVEEYSPASVKKSVTGSGRADKHQVASIIDRLLGLTADRRSHDVSDALAVALCHLAAASLGAAVARSQRRIVR